MPSLGDKTGDSWNQYKGNKYIWWGGKLSSLIKLTERQPSSSLIILLSEYCSGFNDSDNTNVPVQYRTTTSVTDQLSIHGRHSSPVGLCKPEQTDSESDCFGEVLNADTERQRDDVLCTPKYETTAAVASIIDQHDYQTPQSTELLDISDENHCGTPVFPPPAENDQSSSENSPPVLESYNMNASTAAQRIGNQNAFSSTVADSIANSSKGGVPVSRQSFNNAIATPSVIPTYTGLGYIQGMTTGYWQQPPAFAQTPHPIPQVNCTMPLPAPNTYSPCFGLNDSAPTIQAPWPWMLAVGQRFCAYPTSFGEMGHITDSNLTPTLPMTVVQPPMTTVGSHIDEASYDDAQMRATVDNGLKSAFHVVPKEPEHFQGSVNLTSGTASNVSREILPGRSTSKSRIRTSNRHARNQTRNLSDVVDSMKNDSLDFPELNVFPKTVIPTRLASSELAWASSGADDDRSDRSDLESQEQQASSSSSRVHSTHSRPLNRNALRQMKQWYEAHIDRPYPTMEEKVQLAKIGGIKISQVSALLRKINVLALHEISLLPIFTTLSWSSLKNH